MAIVSFSCKKKEVTNQAAIDEEKIKTYIKDNNLNATATGSGLYYIVTVQGTGAHPAAGSTVTVAYKGYLLNGDVFDQSSGNGLTISLNSVIQGWKEGIPLFRKGGGKGKLIIPSALGYGASAKSTIPANSVLVFDVTLP